MPLIRLPPAIRQARPRRVRPCRCWCRGPACAPPIQSPRSRSIPLAARRRQALAPMRRNLAFREPGRLPSWSGTKLANQAGSTMASRSPVVNRPNSRPPTPAPYYSPATVTRDDDIPRAVSRHVPSAPPDHPVLNWFNELARGGSPPPRAPLPPQTSRFRPRPGRRSVPPIPCRPPRARPALRRERSIPRSGRRRPTRGWPKTTLPRRNSNSSRTGAEYCPKSTRRRIPQLDRKTHSIR